MLMHIAERIVASFWVGSLWAVGYLAVPLLFWRIDDRLLAGQIAGDMFTIQSYVGYICAGILFLIMLTDPLRRLFTILVIVGMAALVLYGQFEVQPQMAALKAQGLVESDEFVRLHGVSAVAYLLTSILGLVLLFLGVQANMRAGVMRAEAKEKKRLAAEQAEQARPVETEGTLDETLPVSGETSAEVRPSAV